MSNADAITRFRELETERAEMWKRVQEAEAIHTPTLDSMERICSAMMVLHSELSELGIQDKWNLTLNDIRDMLKACGY